MLKDTVAMEDPGQGATTQPGTDMTSSMLHIQLTASKLAQCESF